MHEYAQCAPIYARPARKRPAAEVRRMLGDTQQIERQSAILRILRDGQVRRQEDLVRLLKKEGHDVTQSSVSRDLRDLGVSKAGGRYVRPADDLTRTNG